MTPVAHRSHLFVKICGLTQPEQAAAVAAMGVSAIGLIAVPTSPRYVTPEQMRAIAAPISPPTHTIGVFVDDAVDGIVNTVRTTGITGVQLHGRESPADCEALRLALSETLLVKAFRLRQPSDLEEIASYLPHVDAILIDAYHPTLAGGTGQTADWTLLENIRFDKPWFLAGGLTPENIPAALAALAPDGIDLSSGVELSPGCKDLARVRAVLDALPTTSRRGSSLRTSGSIA
ncbi:MAG: phosphoribosylanthranilate isomerase [Cyanobacteria bacterium P01_F01_bin.33]